MRMSNLPIFASLEGACVCVEIEPRESRRRFTPSNMVGAGKHGRGAGRIMLFADGKGGMCFNWRTGKAAIFYYDYQGKRPSRAELRKMQAEMRKQRELYEAETRARQYAVSILAAQIWDGADSPMAGHKYLVRKRLPQSRNGLRCIALDKAQALIDQAAIEQEDGEGQTLRGQGRLLVVPLTDDKGVICSVQLIDESGRKTFLKGGRKKGLLWRPHGLSFDAGTEGAIGVAEGVATAMSVTLLYSVPCVAALDAGNLLPCAETLRRQFPGHALRFYADKDASGVGEEKAKAAVRALALQGARCAVLLPPFTEEIEAELTRRTGKAPTDFNDYWMIWSEANE